MNNIHNLKSGVIKNIAIEGRNIFNSLHIYD